MVVCLNSNVQKLHHLNKIPGGDRRENNKTIRDMFGRRPIATNHHLLDQLRLKNLLLTVKQSVSDQFNYLEIISTIDHGYFYTSSDEITFNYCLIVKCC